MKSIFGSLFDPAPLRYRPQDLMNYFSIDSKTGEQKFNPEYLKYMYGARNAFSKQEEDTLNTQQTKEK